MKYTKKPLSILLMICMIVGLMPWTALPAKAESVDSSYSAAFKYNGKTYSKESITGSEDISLTDILTPLEITGTVTAVSVSEDQGMTVTTSALTLTKAFGSGWLEVTAGGTEYHIVIETLPNTISVVLYGSLFFDKNGGSGEMVLTDPLDGTRKNAVYVKEYSNYTLPECGYTAPDGYEFSKWEIKGNQYSAGDTYVFGQTTTAKAIWKLRDGVHDISASFENGNGDVIITPSKAAQGETVTVTVQPIVGKTVDSITYSYGATSGQTLSGGEGGVYTFSMPNENTIVNVTFKNAAEQLPIPYVDENGDNRNCNSYSFVRATDTRWSGWVIASQDLTLDKRVTVNGTANLILMDGKTLTVTNGIQVSGSNTLNIYSQSGNTGALIAGKATNNDNAGIGGNKDNSTVGTININGGKITVVGGERSAGIGSTTDGYGGAAGGAGNITIRGNADVTATAGRGGAAIGTGPRGIGGTVTISGNAKVNAIGVREYSGESGAGIGGGRYGYCDVSITGGTVTATCCANNCAAIGTGAGTGGGGTISITGGTVTATATSNNGVGIGGKNVTIIIGGTANVTATGTKNNSGIGGLCESEYGNTIKIEGGTVKAYAGGTNNGAAAIGSGNKAKGKTTITISGGIVQAYGNNTYGVGIGGGNTGAASEEIIVNISGGSVTSTGRVGIGTANASAAKQTISISGGTVIATGAISDGNPGAAIGQGNKSKSPTTIKITGGKVTANGEGNGIGAGANSTKMPEITLGYSNETQTDMEVTANNYVGTVALSNHFKYKSDGVKVVADSIGESRTIVPGQGVDHSHSFTYAVSVDGLTITAECANTDGSCPLTDGKAALTIGAPLHTTYGDNKSADAQITDANNIKGSATIGYYVADADGNKTGNALGSAPADAGKYRAEITLGTGSGAATAYVVYEIAKATPTCTAPTDLAATYGQTLANVPLTSGWTWKDDASTSVGDAGEQTFTAIYTKDNSGNYNTVEQNLTITVAPKSITGATVTLSESQLVYNGSEQSVSVSSVKLGDTPLTAGTDYDVTSGTTGTEKNTYTVTVTGKGNYTGTATANWEITDKPMTVSAPNVTAIYDGQAHGIVVSVSDPSSGATIKYGDSADSCTLDASPTITNVSGSPKTVYFQVTADSYATYTGSATVTINKAPLTVTANNKTITYGDAPANNGVTYSGFVNSETENLLGGTLGYDYSYTQYGDVGSYTITPKGLTAANYEISFVAGTLTVEQKEVGLTWNTTSLTFNGTAQAPTATATGTVNSDTVNVTVSGAQTDAGMGYTATASGLTGNKAGNYKLPDAKTTTFVIGKAAAPTLSNVALNKVAGTTSITASVAGKMPANAGTLGYTAGSATTTGSATVSSFTVDSIGTVSAEVYGVANDTVTLPVTISSTNYNDSAVNVVVTFVNKTDANVSISGDSAKTYGDAAFTLTASAENTGENGAWTWESSNTAVAEVDNTGKVTIKAASTTPVTITATYSSDTTAGTATLALTVNKATPTITTAPTASAITYGQTLNNSTLTGGAASVAGTFAWTTGSTAPTVAQSGSNFEMTFTPTDSDNYESATCNVAVTVNKATPTITTAPTASAITYGQTLANSTLTGGAASVAGTFAWTTSSTEPAVSDSGTTTYGVTFTPTDSANYNAATTTVTLTVNKAANPATVTGAASVTKGGNTVDLSANVTKNGATGAVSYAISGEANGCTVNASTGVFTSGTSMGSVTVNVTVAADGNYEALTATPITVTITDKTTQTLSFASPTQTKTYGDADFTVTATGAQTTVSYAVTSGTDVATVDNTGKVHILKAGTATITATAAETSEYAGATATFTLNVGKANATVTAYHKTKYVGENDPSFDAKVEGLVNGDAESVIVYTITRDVGEDVGEYAIKLTGNAEQGNYNVTFVNGKLTIKPAKIDVSSVTLNRTTLPLTVGGTATLTATVEPSNASEPEVTWTSGTPAVATVDANGKVTAVAAGMASITATADGKSATCAVTVTARDGGGSTGGGGGGGGGSTTPSTTTTTPSTTTTTTTNADGGKTESTSKTTETKNSDGSTTAKTTETATTTATDGSKTESKSETSTTTKTNTDGTTTASTTATQSATTTDANGAKTTTETKTEAKETLDKSGNGTVEAKTTETVKDANGKVTETTVTESKGTVETAADGAKTTTTTNTATTTDANGNKTTTVTTEQTVEKADGSTGSVVTNENGETVSATATISEKAVEQAQKSGDAVTVPVTVTATNDAATATAVEITVPQGAESVKVEIPVENVKPGTVAVIVNPNGTEEIVKTSTTSDEGVVLTLNAGATVKLVDNTKPMNDVKGDEWYADNIAWATSHEVMNGVGGGNFAPNDPTTQGMMEQLLYNLDGNAFVPAAEDEAWWSAADRWADGESVTQGLGDAHDPVAPATREVDALMMFNYAKAKGYDVSARADLSRFPDAANVSEEAREALAWAVAAGLINGTTDENGNVILDPQGVATRAQVSAIIERFCENVVK